MDNPEQQTKTSRSHGQYENIQPEDVSVEEDLEEGTIPNFLDCCVLFDDMLESSQKLLDPIFTRGRHCDSDVC